MVVALTCVLILYSLNRTIKLNMEGVSATGDIWSTGAFSFESPLKDLLDRGDYTLEELLAEDELLQELRGMHPQLIDFFSTEEAVVGLVKYVTRMQQDEEEEEEEEETLPVIMNGDIGASTSSEEEPPAVPVQQETEKEQEEKQEEEKEATPEDQTPESQEEEEKEEEKKPGQWLFPPMEKPSLDKEEKSPQEKQQEQTIRYPYMACEVICCEINSIIDILVDGHVATKEPVQGHVEENETAVEVTTAKSPSILDLLFSVLHETKPGELDDYRAGYLDKILSVLFRKRPKAMSAYMNNGGISLIKAMMTHLYSHSIMQIVQRLLMPPPVTSFLANNNNNTNGDYDEDEEDDEEDHFNSLFSCSWSELPESIDLLLDSLIVDDNNNNDDDEQLQLLKSQSASEVLITVIQNSPLTSVTLLTLTSEPVMRRIIRAACTLPKGQEEFSPHDSPLTCAINVLESLVLQLGGYGSVGTALEEEEEEEEEAAAETAASVVKSDDEQSIELEVKKILKMAQEVATADSLIQHLPELLQALCGLLRHPSTETWQSPMQFAKSETQPLLGMSRLRIVRLLESLVLLGNPQVDALLCQSDCLEICLDLFWEFQWCSMLHQSVANLLVHVFEGANERAQLQEYFLVKCNLLGRLMDSFQDPQEEKSNDDLLSDAVMAIQRLHLKNRSISVQSERGSSLGDDSMDAAFGDNDDDVIPVSDDDVDAALEQQQQQEVTSELQEETSKVEGEQEGTDTDSTEHESTNEGADDTVDSANEVAEVKSSIPSLRMGCLGHVIIICQALVHACTADVDEPQEAANEAPPEGALDTSMMRSIDLGESPLVANTRDPASETDAKDEDEKGASSVPETAETFETAGSVGEKDTNDEDAKSQVEVSGSQGSVSNDLVISRLVKSHPLHAEWTDFITTTLAAETAIQSTPLGGTNVATVETMQSQLPVARSGRSYDFGSDDAEDAAALDARGFLGGEVLDMDDNDLDIAASMMEALNMSRPRSPNEPNGDEGDETQDAVSNSFGTVVQNSGLGSADYLFDDPLGGNARFGPLGSQDDSSDEEEEPVGVPPSKDDTTSSSPGVDDEDDAPVMDLFTGNFEDKGGSSSAGDDLVAPGNGPFSNFANFDDAFAAASAVEAPIFSSGSSDDDDVLKSAPFEAPLTVDESVDDLFGSTPPHALLLGDEDVNNDKPQADKVAEVPSENVDEGDTDTEEHAVVAESDAAADSPSTVAESLEISADDSATETMSTEPKLETAMSG